MSSQPHSRTPSFFRWRKTTNHFMVLENGRWSSPENRGDVGEIAWFLLVEIYEGMVWYHGDRTHGCSWLHEHSTMKKHGYTKYLLSFHVYIPILSWYIHIYDISMYILLYIYLISYLPQLFIYISHCFMVYLPMFWVNHFHPWLGELGHEAPGRCPTAVRRGEFWKVGTWKHVFFLIL